MALLCIFTFRSLENQPVLAPKTNMQCNIGICYFIFFAILLFFHDTGHNRFCKENHSAQVCVGGGGREANNIFFF